jgi:aerobic carbon-monoxide dehydrogenase small subunit
MNLTVSITVNGNRVEALVPTATLLTDFLRDHAGSKGTLVGCDTAQCGCCTIHLDGDAVKACTILAIQADGSTVTTIEGMANGDVLHPVQQAFHEKHALQCGYCTAGLVMNAADIIARHADLDEAMVRHLIEGNICRCTGYENIVDAILSAAGKESQPHA